MLNNNLVPGQSLLGCQDYKYWSCYRVPIMLEGFRKYLESIHDIHDGSTIAFSLTTRIPDSIIDELENHICDIATTETITQLERASEILANDGDHAGSVNILLSRVKFLSHQRKREPAFNDIKK